MPLQEKLSGNVHQGSGNGPCAISSSVVKARQQLWAEVLTQGYWKGRLVARCWFGMMLGMSLLGSASEMERKVWACSGKVSVLGIPRVK